MQGFYHVLDGDAEGAIWMCKEHETKSQGHGGAVHRPWSIEGSILTKKLWTQLVRCHIHKHVFLHGDPWRNTYFVREQPGSFYLNDPTPRRVSKTIWGGWFGEDMEQFQSIIQLAQPSPISRKPWRRARWSFLSGLPSTPQEHREVLHDAKVRLTFLGMLFPSKIWSQWINRCISQAGTPAYRKYTVDVFQVHILGVKSAFMDKLTQLLKFWKIPGARCAGTYKISSHRLYLRSSSDAFEGPPHCACSNMVAREEINWIVYRSKSSNKNLRGENPLYPILFFKPCIRLI